MHPVFVYGTLKQGFPNFHVNKGTRVQGEFFTRKKYLFYLVTERYSPWLILEEGKGSHIHGQVFMVDNNTIDEMDALERINDQDGYRKVQIAVTSNEIKEDILAYVYVKPVEHLKNADIKLGPLSEYELSHSLLYRPFQR